MHPDGYIQLKDRSKDIIISGGENISSIEIEEVLYRHPSVSVVAVVATPDDKWGEVPCAFVELADGDKTSKQQLLNWCREQLASYKVPKRIEFIEIPRTSTGKIQKYVLRELLQKGSIKIQKVDEVNY
jgi:fatty-acyl-CoA synthase